MPTVKLFANLRTLTGTKETSISGATVGAVLTQLVKRYPALDGVILENQELRPHMVLTLNGHTITDFETPVTEQDNIAVFPPIAGG